MGKLSANDIIKMSNPYEQVFKNDFDSFVENKQVYDNLRFDIKIKVACSFVIHCPKGELNGFMRKIEAIRDRGRPNEGFYPVLFDAAKTRQIIEGLMDEKNGAPHKMLTGSEFHADLFQQYEALVRELVAGREDEIACHLAIKTPDNKLQELQKNARLIGNAFIKDKGRDSALAAALELRHGIQKDLLGGSPANFFKAKQDRTDLCIRFPGLVCAMIAGQEEALGQQLAGADPHTRGLVNRKLDALLCHVENRDNHPLIKLEKAYSQAVAANTEKETSPLVARSLLGSSAKGRSPDRYDPVPLNEEKTDGYSLTDEDEIAEEAACPLSCSIL